MSLQKNLTKLTEKINIAQNGETTVELSTQNPTTQENMENEQLIKPIPINLKLIKKSKSGITTVEDSTLTIKPIIQELKIPLLFPNYNYPNIIQYNSSLGDNFINKKESNDNNSITYKKEKFCCNCTKTQCIKKYCECFASNNYCVDCNCNNCLNKYIDYNNHNIIKLNENENNNEKVICTCSKSHCNKKYCECFKLGKKCGSKCRCLDCMNMEKGFNNFDENKNNEININKIINDNNNSINDVLYKNNKNDSISEEKKLISSKTSDYENIYDTFKIQRISIFINKNHTSINVEKLSKEEMNLLSKKRKLS